MATLEVSHFGPFGLNATTRVLTKNNGTSLKSSTRFGMNSSSNPKWLGSGFWDKSRNVVSRLLPCFKVSIRLWEIGKFCVEGIICILLGIGKDNVVRWFLVVRGLFLGWWGGGDPWFGGFGGLSIVGLVRFYFLRGSVSHPRGLPSMWARLL